MDIHSKREPVSRVLVALVSMRDLYSRSAPDARSVPESGLEALHELADKYEALAEEREHPPLDGLKKK